jgi:tetratricopeptide (TPR) repeat protein
MIIREPFYKMAMDGYSLIRVDVFSDIVFLAENDPMLKNVSFPTKFKEAGDSEAYKTKGNKFLQEKNYQVAIVWYSNAITLNQLPVYYCNRSYAYFLIENFQNSLNDAREAIKLDSKSLKGWYRA